MKHVMRIIIMQKAVQFSEVAFGSKCLLLLFKGNRIGKDVFDAAFLIGLVPNPFQEYLKKMTWGSLKSDGSGDMRGAYWTTAYRHLD